MVMCDAKGNLSAEEMFEITDWHSIGTDIINTFPMVGKTLGCGRMSRAPR